MSSKCESPAPAGARALHNSTAASNTGKPQPTQATGRLSVKCTEFKPFIRHTLRGFAAVHIGRPLGLTIRDIPVHSKGERCWAQLPSKPQVKDGALVKNADGRIQYVPMLAWDTRAVADAFSDAVVRAVREHTPDAFDGEMTP